MVSALDQCTPERAVRVRALAGDIVLCSWARHLTLTVPLSNQVYKWVPANLMLGGSPVMDWHPIQGGVEILLHVHCSRFLPRKLELSAGLMGPRGPNADFNFTITICSTLAFWLVHSSLGQAIQVQFLVADIVLCSQAWHFSLTVPLSTQVYKWVLATLLLGVTL